jgi:hypothetical protein
MNAPRRLLIPLLVGVLALVMVGALAILAVPGALTALHDGGIDIREAQATCPTLPSSTLGASAITPRNDCTPSFTAQHVLAFENAHPFVGHLEVVGKPKISKIWFITSAEARGQMQGESTGLSDDALVCYVEFYGTFRVYGIPDPNASKSVEHPGKAQQLFDAHTGNLLVFLEHPLTPQAPSAREPAA